MSIRENLLGIAGQFILGAVDIIQDLAMEPLSGSMRAELIILARKSQRKPAPSGSGPSRAALRRRGLVQAFGNALTDKGWRWYKRMEVNGDVDDFLCANNIDP